MYNADLIPPCLPEDNTVRRGCNKQREPTDSLQTEVRISKEIVSRERRGPYS
jgi:hypothetical protein